MRALVTGASGFVGGAVCARLLEPGDEVFALVRRAGSAPAGTTALLGDLGDGAALETAIAAAAPDVVFHLAAEIASQRNEERIREVNVEGTRRLVAACRAAPAPPKLVFTSTVVTGEAGGALLDEDTPLNVDTPYGRSKQEGERSVLGSGLRATVIRPSHVYGPGGWYAEEMVARLRAPGRFAVVGRGENLWDVVHVDDVASACLLAAADAAADGEVFHCADDSPTTYYDFMALTARELGLGPPRRIPVALARLHAARHTVTAVVRSARSSNAKLKRVVGWAPRYPSAQQGVPAAVAALTTATAGSP
jgi:nucleoside-diphosphate-sugar epimerase